MPDLSIIIPTLNASADLPACLDATVGQPGVAEVIVADGGSTDPTQDVARTAGARVVPSPPGRGTQLGHGAAAAACPWLLFLHADTRLDPGWTGDAQEHAKVVNDGQKAAVFTFALDDPSPAARRVERLTRWRGRVLGLPYGDQGLLISRDLYDRIGGYRPLPLMEDVDLIQRLGKHRLTILPTRAVTSAARYQADGWWARPIRNLACLAAWKLGVPAEKLATFYQGSSHAS